MPMPVAPRRLSDRHLFAQVLYENPELCRQVLERVLRLCIGSVEFTAEQAELYPPERRAVRCKAQAQDSQASFYVEMRMDPEGDAARRMRFCHSRFDQEFSEQGCTPEEAPRVFTVFFCLADPFGFGRPVYTFRRMCDEDASVSFGDGQLDIVLAADGNLSLAPGPVASLLAYLKTGEVDGCDGLVVHLDKAAEAVRTTRSWNESVRRYEQDRAFSQSQAWESGVQAGRELERAELLDRLVEEGVIALEEARRCRTGERSAALALAPALGAVS